MRCTVLQLFRDHDPSNIPLPSYLLHYLVDAVKPNLELMGTGLVMMGTGLSILLFLIKLTPIYTPKKALEAAFLG
jgi:hypothetical protein